MQPATPTVDLIEFEGLGLVVRWPSGVRYTNQVAGYGCEHPEIEGVFVPLCDGIGRPALYAIRQHFRGGWHALTTQDADILDGILRRAALGFITCDRTNLTDSREAWVCVAVSEDSSARLQGFAPCVGILTWPNSD